MANQAVLAMEVLAIRLPDVNLWEEEHFNQTMAIMEQAKSSGSWVYVFYTASDVLGNDEWLFTLAGYEAGLLNNQTTFLFAETNYKVFDGSNNALLPPAAHASLSGSFSQRGKTIKNRYDAYMDFISGLDPDAILAMGMQEADINNLFEPTWITQPTGLAEWNAFRFDGAVTMFLALHEMRQAGLEFSASDFMDAVKATTLKGVFGDISWDESLNRQGLVYNIFQLQVLPLSPQALEIARDSLYPLASKIVNVASIALTPGADGLLHPVIDIGLVRYRNGVNTQTGGPLVMEAPSCEPGYFKDFPFQSSSACKPCAAGSYRNMERGFSSCTRCSKGTYSALTGSSICTACPAGRYARDVQSTACEVCSPGSFAEKQSSECRNCSIGTAQGEAEQSQCNICPPGTHAPTKGSLQCANCSAGTYQREEQQADCTECTVGKHSAEEVSIECQDCLPGKYQSSAGQSECAKCPDGMTTYHSRSVSRVACLCSSGLFLVRADPTSEGSCEICVEGLDCNWLAFVAGRPEENTDMVDQLIRETFADQTEPHTLRGFYANTREELPAAAFTGISGKLSVWECFSDDRMCPGGKPGTCAFGRQNIACAECQDSMVPSDDGTCQDCEAGSSVPFVCAILGLVVIMVVVYYVVDTQDRANQPKSLVTTGLVIGILITFVQQVGVLSVMAIYWVAPLSTIFELTKVLHFDIQLLRMECFTSMSPFLKFAMKLAGGGSVILCTIVIHIIWVACKHHARFKQRMPTLVSVTGTFFTVFLIATVNMAIVPLQCSGKHPSGLTTNRKYSTVICEETGEHDAMRSLGLVALIVPVIFLVACFHAVYQFPRRIQSFDIRFLQMFSFLLFKFKPEVYWLTPLLTDHPSDAWPDSTQPWMEWS